MSDNIHVAVRVRPLIPRENQSKAEIFWRVENKRTIVQLDNEGRPVSNSSFVFDRVFDTHESNVCVYKELCHPIVESVMEGFNGTIFAYGQTSSGKTYTMSGTTDNPGIITFTITSIFDAIENMPEREFLLRISYMEIYNESVSDLLSENLNHNLKIYENTDGQVAVQDLKEETVTNYNQVMDLWKRGEKKRHTGETSMNERSSRSHSIFRMIIESRKREGSLEDAVNVSQLNLIDLAGSERAGQMGVTGERFKEGVHINKSLLMLGHVISRLSVDDQQFVNYRDSKLTRILQNSLGGNARTAIICTVTPAASQQTHSTLMFASHAKCIKNKPIINEVLTDAAVLRRYKKKIQQLNEELQNVKTSNHLDKVTAMERELEEKDRRLEELEKKIKDITKNLVVSRQAKPNQQMAVRKSRRETWAGSLAHFPELTGMIYSGDGKLPNFGLPSVDEEMFDLSGISFITSQLSEEDANFVQLPPEIFEANLQVQEQMHDTVTVKPTKIKRRTVTFSLPLVDTAAQTEEMHSFEEKSWQEIAEAYDDLKSEYEKVLSDSAELQEFTKLEKQILSSDNNSQKELITVLYKHIKDQENHFAEIRNILVKHCSPMRKPVSSYIVSNKLSEKIDELQHELCELKQQQEISDKLRLAMQQEKEEVTVEYETILERKCKREEELCSKLVEAYNELSEIKSNYSDVISSEMIYKEMEQKNNIITALQSQLSELQPLKEKVVALEEQNKKCNNEIVLLLKQIETYKDERSQIKSDVLSFYEPLSVLKDEIICIVGNNLKLETRMMQLEQQNCEAENSSELKSVDILNSTIYNESCKNYLSESSSERDLQLKHIFEQAVVEDYICERLFFETIENEHFMFYRLQCEHEVMTKNFTEELDVLKDEFFQKLFEISRTVEHALGLQDQKYNNLLISLPDKLNVQCAELDLLKTNLSEKLESIESMALTAGSHVTSLLDTTRKLKSDVLVLKEKQEKCNIDINTMKEKINQSNNDSNEIEQKCQNKLDEIFKMQMEFEAEKWKQEQFKCELFEELYQIENNALEMERDVKKQLACYEKLELKKKQEKELDEQVSSLLQKVDEKEEEIKKYKQSLAATLKELNLQTERFHEKEETVKKVVLRSCVKGGKNAAVQCSILSSREDKFTETEPLDRSEEQKNAEIQCLICNADTTENDKEKEDLKKELEELYENFERYLIRLNQAEQQKSYFETKVKHLQEELTEKNKTMNKQKKDVVEIATQTDGGKDNANPRLSEDAMLQMQRNLGQQKILMIDLKNQLAQERINSRVSREENEFLNRKIHQLKLNIRMLQQPTDRTFVEQAREKPNESSSKKVEAYERGGSGIINSVKLDMMENQIHTLERQVKKLRKENSFLKRLSSESKETEFDKKENENRNESRSLPTSPQETKHVEERIGNVSSSNPLQAVTNNSIQNNSIRDLTTEEGSNFHPNVNNLDPSQDCHVQ